jgi:alkanesulfonate monooxygenase SsuD/methylene tetrahydromethanopterin reductase-like flavin-dependent oxidoreductase (luciferase family)
VKVGYTLGFQNVGNRLSDEEVYEQDLRLADVAVAGGFDAVWVVEHHFSNYFMSPDPLQFLTWMAARHPHIEVGTGVIVLPWHDPVRCTEQIALLDNLSGGRVILGIGRGLGRDEYGGFRVDMESSRERFVAYAEVILGALESGWIEADGPLLQQPRREIRPKPARSFRGRTYAAAMSPEAMPIMAELGVGLLIVPQKPWPSVRADLDAYHSTWQKVHGSDLVPPAPLCAGNTFVDANADRAREKAHQYIGGYYQTIIDHYGFAASAHRGLKGYEFYAGIGKHIEKRGADGAVADYVNLMPWGTPDQVLAKLSDLHQVIDMGAFNPSFNFAGMPYSEAEASIKLFAEEVLPVLQTWTTTADSQAVS